MQSYLTEILRDFIRIFLAFLSDFHPSTKPLCDPSPSLDPFSPCSINHPKKCRTANADCRCGRHITRERWMDRYRKRKRKGKRIDSPSRQISLLCGRRVKYLAVAGLCKNFTFPVAHFQNQFLSTVLVCGATPTNWIEGK